MAYTGQYYEINKFNGGYAGNLPDTQIALNQAADLDNIVIKPNGAGFRSRLGDAKFNSAAMNSGAVVTGLGYYLQADADKFLMATCGNKIFKSDALDGTMDDITGALTLTAGAANLWDIFTFNDVCLGIGGAPNPAWKWTGTGNAAALADNPSSSLAGGFAANNRVFGWLGSTMYWTVIGDYEDWSGSGSGSAVAGSLSDNETIVGATVLSTNYVLVFKQNSTHQMVISSAPFPMYSLFDNVGCCGKKAMVNVDGEVYFITSQGEMVSTDGETLKTYPPIADDLWDAVLPAYYSSITGYRHKGADFDHIVWCVTTTGTTNNKAIIWDLLNKCWLQFSTGHKYNVVTHAPDGTVYTGNYAGFVLKPETAATYGDASESTATITSYWQSGWMNPDNLNRITQVRKMTLLLTPKASGSVTVAYGFDGIANGTSTTASQVASSTEVYCQENVMLTGRGNTFEYKVSLASSAIDMEVQRIILAGKTYGQKGQAEN